MASARFHMMAKPTSYRCNLKCEYCFYLEKESFLDRENNKQPLIMPDSILKRYIRDYIESQDVDTIDFSWQGGEPTLAGLDFYKKVVEYQRQYANGKTITNSFQTNAVAINRQWAKFFAKHKFLIGVSVDGTPAIHDKYRISVNGKPTFERVKKAIDLLLEYNVDFNVLTVVNDQNWNKGVETYQFLKSLGAKFLQFIPIVEVENSALTSLYHYTVHKTPSLAHFSVPSDGYGQFMVDVFEEWLKEDVGRIYVRMFDSILATWFGYPASICIQSKTCGQAMVIEANGDVYSCDHYVYPANRLGNVTNLPLSKIATNKIQQRFGDTKATDLTDECLSCDVYKLCYGGCPKHRIVSVKGQKYKQNYLCPSYQKIFRHTAPAMYLMMQTISQGGTAVDALPMIRQARN